jgi:hypothetical protein
MKKLTNRLLDDGPAYTPGSVERIKSLGKALGSYEAERDIKPDRRLSEFRTRAAAEQVASSSTCRSRPVLANGSWNPGSSPYSPSVYNSTGSGGTNGSSQEW